MRKQAPVSLRRTGSAIIYAFHQSICFTVYLSYTKHTQIIFYLRICLANTNRTISSSDASCFYLKPAPFASSVGRSLHTDPRRHWCYSQRSHHSYGSYDLRVKGQWIANMLPRILLNARTRLRVGSRRGWHRTYPIKLENNHLRMHVELKPNFLHICIFCWSTTASVNVGS